MALRVSAIGRGDRQRIVVVDVAQIASHVGMPIRQQESCGAVVENSRRPGGDRVARRASRSRRRESRRDVVRHRPANRRGAHEGGLVATITIRRTEGVVVVDMAGGAGRRRWRHVRSGQRKSGNAMIERRGVPTLRRMASGTICRRKRRSGCGVHRIIRLLPGRQMALGVPAIGRGDRQRIVVIDVAQIASHVGVAIGQLEAGRAVVKNSRRPCGNRVARRASRSRRRESRP